MRKIFNAIKAGFQRTKETAERKISAISAKTKAAFYMFVVRSNAMLAENRGENFVDSGIKILIAVVIGALLLGGLYALFGDTIMPTVTKKVKDMFEFKG